MMLFNYDVICKTLNKKKTYCVVFSNYSILEQILCKFACYLLIMYKIYFYRFFENFVLIAMVNFGVQNPAFQNTQS